MRNTTRWWPSDLGLLALGIAVPVTFANCVALLAGSWLPPWVSLACSFWALLVLQFGPIRVPRAGKEIEKE